MKSSGALAGATVLVLCRPALSTLDRQRRARLALMGFLGQGQPEPQLALIIAGVIGIPLLAIRTFAASRSARAALEQAKTTAERHDEQMKADRERRITESFTAGRYVFYAWPRQVADFYDMRVRKNVEFGQRFAGVGGMADVVGLHREYVRDTLLDYASSVYEMAGFGIWDRIIDEFTREKSPLHAHLEDLEAELAAFEGLRRICREAQLGEGGRHAEGEAATRRRCGRLRGGCCCSANALAQVA